MSAGDRDRRVPQPVADSLSVSPDRQPDRRAGVPQLVQIDPRQPGPAGQPLEALGHRLRRYGAPFSVQNTNPMSTYAGPHASR